MSTTTTKTTKPKMTAKAAMARLRAARKHATRRVIAAKLGCSVPTLDAALRLNRVSDKVLGKIEYINVEAANTF